MLPRAAGEASPGWQDAHHGARLLALAVLVVATGVLSSACFLKQIFGVVTTYYVGEGVEAIFAAADGNATTAVCIDSFGYIDCTYIVGGWTITSTWQLVQDYGFLGLLIDPIILQVPADATAIQAAFNAGTGTHAAVTTLPSSVDIQPGMPLAPEPGYRLVVLEFPPAVLAAIAGDTEPRPVTFTLQFELASLRTINVKMLLTQKATVGASTFYLPMVPCVTSFASVPAMTIATGAAPVSLGNQLTSLASSVEGCDHKQYDLRGASAGPYRSFAPAVGRDGG